MERLLRVAETTEPTRYKRAVVPIHFPSEEEAPETKRHLELRTVFLHALEALLFSLCALRDELRVGVQLRHQLCRSDLVPRHGMKCRSIAPPAISLASGPDWRVRRLGPPCFAAAACGGEEADFRNRPT
jgi:hypothetical protein